VKEAACGGQRPAFNEAAAASCELGGAEYTVVVVEGTRVLNTIVH